MDMYKKIWVTLLITCCVNVYSQESYDVNGDLKQVASSLDLTKMSFGLKVSPTVSWINVANTDMQADGACLKFGVGGVLNYEILPSVSLVSGVNYNSYGGYVYDNNSLNNTVFRNNYLVNYDEIEVPIAVKIKTTSNNKTNYFLQGGFSAGFVIKASEKRIPVDKTAKPDYDDITLMTTPTRLNYLVGAGIEYSLAKKTYLFGLISYKSSLTNQANSSAYVPGRYSTSLQMYPGNMEFSVGIMF